MPGFVRDGDKDDSCIHVTATPVAALEGCTDTDALNYDANAEAPCTASSAQRSLGNGLVNCPCTPRVWGCMYIMSVHPAGGLWYSENYDPAANSYDSPNFVKNEKCRV